MKIFEWQEKLVRKVKEKNMMLTVLGKAIALLALGAIFSTQLAEYGYLIIVIAAIFSLMYINRNFISWHRKEKINYSRHSLGWTGVALLLVYLGIQTPQMPFKIYFLVIGILLTIPSLVNIFKNKK